MGRSEGEGEEASEGTGSGQPEGLGEARFRLSVSGQPVVRSGYDGMMCAGCARPFGRKTMRTLITPGGVGMIHNVRDCLDKARRSMRAEAEAERSAGLGPQEGMADTLKCVEIESEVPEAGPLMGKSLIRDGCAQRKAQFRERIGPNRRERVRLCLAGRCGETTEVQMVCLGRVDGEPCPATVHGVACAQLKKGHASLGCFLCTDCRVRKLGVVTDGDAAGSIAETAMLVQMSSGAEATGASYFDFKTLER